MDIRFFKYEGAGNDFIVIDNRAGEFDPRPGLVAALCDRRTGVGADGMMLLESDPETMFRMRYFNSDGPEATMCGNGGRCMALFAQHLGIGGRCKRFVASDGIHTASINSAEGETAQVTLAMRDVSGIEPYGKGWLLDTGSPHYVEFTHRLCELDVLRIGRLVRHDPGLAAGGGANVNFVEPTGPGRLAVRTYERGVEDETRACGTGAVAAALTAFRAAEHPATAYTVTMPGGALSVSFTPRRDGSFTEISLTGPARRVFSGIFKSDNFTDERSGLGKNF